MSTERAEPRTAAPPDEHFAYRLSTLGEGVTRISLSGELDLASAPALEEGLRSAGAGATIVVIDLDLLTFIDCSGARVLRAAAASRRGNDPRFIVLNACPHVERTLRLMGVDRCLRVVSTPPELAAQH
jgi:anti-anti-sigma factor